MAELTISEIRVIEWGEDPISGPSDETLAAGDAVRFDVTDGQLTAANGTDGTESDFVGLVVAIDAGQVVTVAGNGSLVTLGAALASVNYGAYIYLDDTDKKLTTASGESTDTKIFGIVEAVHQHGTVYKALRIRKGDS
jgi:hypothetical protein